MEFYIDISRSGEIKSKFQEIIKELGGYEKKLLRVSKEIGKISGFEEMEQKVAALHEELVSERKSVEELLDIYLKCVQCYKDTEEKLVSSDIFDGHMLLDIGGLIPGIGMACDGINAGWYASEGDWSNALLSGLSFLPAIGEISGIGKVGAKIISHADDAADIVKAADKVGDVAKAADDAADIFKGLNRVKKGSLGTNLLDDMGKFADDMLENNYQAYVNRKIKKGQTPKDRLEWKEASDYWTKESPVARGNNFNKTVREADIYDYHEIYLENGKRLDSYDPDAGEIISRKATDLDKITEETYREYLSEFSQKYSEGTKIRSNVYPELDGQELKGQYILEIPASNANISNIEYYEQIAAEYDVILRFTEEIQ